MAFISLLIGDLLGLLVYAAFPFVVLAALTVHVLFASMKRVGTRPLLGMIISLLLEAVLAESDTDGKNDAQTPYTKPSWWLYMCLIIAVVGSITLMSTTGSNASVARMDNAQPDDSLDLDEELGSMHHSGKVFHCSHCEWKSTYTHLECVRNNYTSKLRGLWNIILKQPQTEGYSLVTCPACNENLLQCNHCELNVKETEDEKVGRSRRSPQGYMDLHLHCVHGVVNNPNTGPNVSVSEDLHGDVMFDCEDGNDCIHELQAPSSQALRCHDNHLESVDQCQPDSYNDHLETADQCQPDEAMLIKNITDQHMAEEEDQASQWLLGLLNGHLNKKCRYCPEDEIRIPNSDGGHSYEDFSFFDTREEDEKYAKNRKGNTQKILSQNQLYFYQRYKHQRSNPGDGTGGFAGLVHRANVGNREDPSRSAPPHEAEQMFHLLRMLLKISGTLRKQLIVLQNGLLNMFGVNRIAHNIQTRFPVDMNDVRTMVLEGANSILENFPSPKVEIRSKHACVSLKETIRLAAGHGAKFNFGYDPQRTGEEIYNRDGLNGTRAFHRLSQDIGEAMINAGTKEDVVLKTRIGWVYLWSDSFLRCFIKQKENSVWVLTATVCPFENDKSTGSNTYILAIGKSGDDHTDIINHYIKECSELMAGFDCYFGDRNEIGRVAVGMITYHADRPERQMATGTRKEGAFGKISGWAVDVSGEFEDKFPACDRCYRKRVLEMIGGTETDSVTSEAESAEENTNTDHCSECFNWKLDQGDARQKIRPSGPDWPHSMDEEFLADHDLDEPRDRVSGPGMLGPVKLTTIFLKSALSLAYHSFRLSRWTKKQFVAYLRSCNISGSVVEKVEVKAYEDRDEDCHRDPEEYMPEIWSQLEVFDRFRFPDLPMHALAHGIVPDVMDIIHSIFTHYKKYKAFIDFANPILEEIISLRLDYCKLKSLPKAAWVGENSMAYMRLLSYLYGMFLSNNPLASTETGETREVVANLKCLLNALQALMSILMSRSQPDKDDVDRHMKLFMSSAHFLHKRFGSLTNKKTQTLVQKLEKDDLEKLLDEFGIRLNTGETRGNLQKAVTKINAQQWREKCQKMGLEKKGRKEELVERLIRHVIGEERIESIGEEEEADKRSSKDEKKCWNRGNWLSFTANIAEQIEYLGPLYLIW